MENAAPKIYNCSLFWMIGDLGTNIPRGILLIINTWKYCTAELSSVLSENTDSWEEPVQSDTTRLKYITSITKQEDFHL